MGKPCNTAAQVAHRLRNFIFQIATYDKALFQRGKGYYREVYIPLCQDFSSPIIFTHH